MKALIKITEYAEQLWVIMLANNSHMSWRAWISVMQLSSHGKVLENVTFHQNILENGKIITLYYTSVVEQAECSYGIVLFETHFSTFNLEFAKTSLQVLE